MSCWESADLKDAERERAAEVRTAGLERLAHLPEALRKLAAEFLDEHEAWGTEFVAENFITDEVELRWDDFKPGRGVTQYAQLNAHARSGWHLAFGVNGYGSFIAKLDSHEPLRRSADFAEFVQRFREGGE